MGKAWEIRSSARLLRLEPGATGGLTIRCGEVSRFVPWPVVDQLTPGEMGRAVAAVARAGGDRQLWITDSRMTIAATGIAVGNAWLGPTPGASGRSAPP
jgi:hypothetical protein